MYRVGAVARGFALPVFLLLSAPAMAAPLADTPAGMIGVPIEQVFLGRGASLVRTETAAACVTSQPIDIASSGYAASGTGAPVPFAEIVRSHAASAQFIATVPDDTLSLRVQLKFAADATAPMILTAGAMTIDLAPLLEPSGDSVRLTDATQLAAVRAVLEQGGALALSVRSRDTGRTVSDRVEGIDFTTFDACRSGAARPVDDPMPGVTNTIAIAFTASPLPEARATPAETAICRVDDPAAVLYRGRLDRVSGFFAQTDAVFVTYAADGEIGQVFIPGIFEGRRGRDGRLAALLSVAANGNDPLAPAQVSGCLGPAPVTLCAEAAGDGHRFAQCVGDLLAGSLFDDAAFLSDFALDPAPRLSGLPGPLPERRTPPGTVPFTDPGGGGGGRPPRGPDDPLDPDQPAPPPTVVPLPGAGVALATGLALLWWRRRQGLSAAASSNSVAWRSATTAGSSS